MAETMSLGEKIRNLMRGDGHETKQAGLTGSQAYMVASYVPGQPVWTPRRYDALAEEGYRRNVIAFRAVEEIARCAASVPLKLRGPEGEIEGHPLTALLAAPNPKESGMRFRRAWFATYLIAGNAYIEALTDAEGDIYELWQRRPDRVQVVAGRGGMVSAYKINENGKARSITVDSISGASSMLHSKSYHPLDDWYGMSPLEAAAISVDQFNAGAAWNQAMLQNGARPTGTLTSRDSLTDQQFERLKEQLEELYQGGANAGRPMLLEGGLSWQEMGFSPRDMDFLEGRHSAAREIAQAFGVPPQLLGIPGDSTFSNYQEARLHFWENTVLPLVSLFAEEITRWLLPRYAAADAKLCACLEDLPALAPRRHQRWDMLQQSGFLTVNEKRAALGFAPLDGGDRLPAETE